MFKNGLSAVVLSAAIGGSALMASSAHAHINMYGPLQSRNGDQKKAPCEDRPRGRAYTFEPGATIQLGVDEFIKHDGYFRISFDNDGTDDFKDPVSINPVNPNRYGTGKKCEGTARDNCGKSDFCSVVSHDGGPTVLWDNLNPHISRETTNTRWTWNVTLPNVECDNCTIQVMQVMEDPAGGFHGPFDGDNDLYYRCVDIVLKKGAGKTPGTVALPGADAAAPKNDGIDCLKANPPAAAGQADAGPAADAGTAADASSARDAASPLRPRALVEGEGAALDLDESESAAVADSAGGCSLSSTAGGDGLSWQHGALGLLMGTLFIRNRRRARQGREG